MTISRDEIRKTAQLARLGLGESELDQFAADLTRIAAYFQQLRELKLDDAAIAPVLPLVAITGALREDSIGRSLTPDEATRQAPQAEDRFFRVPKVIG